MRNILNYRYGTLFTGKEIKDWCQDQVENSRDHKKEAKYIISHYGLIDNVLYRSIPVWNFVTGTRENNYYITGFERMSKDEKRESN